MSKEVHVEEVCSRGVIRGTTDIFDSILVHRSPNNKKIDTTSRYMVSETKAVVCWAIDLPLMVHGWKAEQEFGNLGQVDEIFVWKINTRRIYFF
jgi:hypothetical protein